MSRITVARIVCLLSFVICHFQTAYAADPADTKAAYAWSGAYIGAFAGYSFLDLEYQEPDYTGYEREPDIDGFTGGVFAGYNHQINQIVLGIQLDGGWGDLSEGPSSDENNTYSAFDINWNAHALARIGLVNHATLLYALGGMGFADVTLDDTDESWGENDSTHMGWTVGCGIEHAINRNFRLRVEYLYDDYGSEDYSITGPITYQADIDLTAHAVRVGLSYCF